jgi:hypothetical protein
VWYFGAIPTVWYFGAIPTVWYFGPIPTVWYFGAIPTVWYGKNPIFRHIKSNNSGTAKVKIIKKERDPPLLTTKQLTKF